MRFFLRAVANTGVLASRLRGSMRRVVGWGMLALTLAMVLGVGSASGRTLVTTTSAVTVQVIGPGRVKSTPSGSTVANGNTDCYAAFSGGV